VPAGLAFRFSQSKEAPGILKMGRPFFGRPCQRVFAAPSLAATLENVIERSIDQSCRNFR
jgi:hypothetical protein